MRKSMIMAVSLMAGSGVTGAAAATLPNPFLGSDTLQNVIRNSISNAVSSGTPAFPISLGPSQSANYIAGGSAAGQNAMTPTVAANATQQVNPTTKMLSACKAFGGGANGAAMNNGTGIVLGLDAVDVIASVEVGASTSCSSANSDAQDYSTGLAHNATAVFGSNSSQNWKWILALVYGGLDYNTGITDCNQASRRALVNNWTALFQNGCANSTDRGGLCGDTAHVNGGDGTNVPLWHAFRRDESASTSDVFSQLIGISGFASVSDTAVNGFGTSPYCNALNWDTNTENNNGGTACNLPGHDQWVGPGGIVDPQSAWTFTKFGAAETNPGAGHGNHRRPPPGTWGDSPDPAKNKVSSADVLPTPYQDNDPIRRPCLGTAAAAGVSAENVCNLDGALGLVLSVPTSDFITDPALNQSSPPVVGVQYPTVACDNSFILGFAPKVYNCAPWNVNNLNPSTHSGQCENGDLVFGTNQCFVPVNNANSTSACLSKKGTFNGVTVNPSLPAPDGRVYNVHMRDGDFNDGSVNYWHQRIIEPAGTINRDFVGGIGRIHSAHFLFDGTAPSGVVPCAMLSVGDQMGCLVQADPCSIGYEGDGSTNWNQRSNQNGITNPSGSVSAAIRIDGIAPNADTVHAAGSCASGTCTGAPTASPQQQQYPLARKVYFTSAIGFQNVTNTTADPNGTGEIQLAEYLSDPTGANTGVTIPINTVLTQFGFFTLGGLNTAAGTDTQFCEDYNQDMVCNSGTALSQDNACARNPAGIPGSTGSTICGNGTLDPFEECDDGPTQSSRCTTACRCKGALRFTGNGTTSATRCTP